MLSGAHLHADGSFRRLQTDDAKRDWPPDVKEALEMVREIFQVRGKVSKPLYIRERNCDIEPYALRISLGRSCIRYIPIVVY